MKGGVKLFYIDFFHDRGKDDVKMWKNWLSLPVMVLCFRKVDISALLVDRILFHFFSISSVVRGIRADAFNCLEIFPKCPASSEMSNSVRVSIAKHVYSRWWMWLTVYILLESNLIFIWSLFLSPPCLLTVVWLRCKLIDSVFP